MQIPCVYIPGPAPAVSVANIYYRMINSPETVIKVRHRITFTQLLLNTTRAMVTASQYYVLCAWWVLDVASDQSCCPPGSPMEVLPPPPLQINCLSRSPLGGPGTPLPPPFPWWPHFPQVHALTHPSVCYKYYNTNIYSTTVPTYLKYYSIYSRRDKFRAVRKV